MIPEEKQLKKFLDKHLDNYASDNQYGVSKIPMHLHTGVDSPRVDYKSIANKPITASSNALPKGWTLTSGGTGQYTVIHGLNNRNYAVIATPIIGTALGCAVTTSVNSFDVHTFNALGVVNSNFYFNLIPL